MRLRGSIEATGAFLSDTDSMPMRKTVTAHSERSRGTSGPSRGRPSLDCARDERRSLALHVLDGSATGPGTPPWLATGFAFVALLLIALPAQAARRRPATTELEAAAAKAYGAGEFKRAAQLCHRIYERDPRVADALFNAARAEQRAEMFAEAERDFEAYLAKVPANDSGRGPAQRYLADIRAALKKRTSPPLPEASAPTRPAIETSKAPAATPAKSPPALALTSGAQAATAIAKRNLLVPPTPPARVKWGQASFVAGVLFVAAGGVSAWRAQVASDDYALGYTGGRDPISARGSNHTWSALSVVGLAGGAALTAVGAWLWFGRPSHATGGAR